MLKKVISGSITHTVTEKQTTAINKQKQPQQEKDSDKNERQSESEEKTRNTQST